VKRCFGHTKGGDCPACDLYATRFLVVGELDRHAVINRVAERIAAPGVLSDADVNGIAGLVERLAAK
jgi:hypothetical protein